MELLHFLNTHLNSWEQELTTAPYYLRINHDGPYIIFSYQQFLSDLRLPICQEARGAIFHFDAVDNEFIPISIAFYKFFNYGEDCAAAIDWNTAVVTEKIDGSLMKLAYDLENGWLLSTNGTIDANKAMMGSSNLSFGWQFRNLVRDYWDFISQLDRDFTYYFEMVSPENRIVCRYEPAVYYLGRRNMQTLREDFSTMDFSQFGIKNVRQYAMRSLAECVQAAKELGENKEGFVVRDSNGNRIKVKSPWYLAAFHLRANGQLSVKRVCEMLQMNIIDDYVGNFPDDSDFVYKVLNVINELVVKLDNAWLKNMHIKDQRDYAKAVSSYPPLMRAYLFKKKASLADITPIDYIKNQLRLSVLSEYVEHVLYNEVEE